MATLPSSSSSRQTRSSSRRTRGPLQELPLELFLLPPTISTPTSKLGSSTKRPISPGTPALYSPAKRRILNEEGLFAAKSPLSASVLATSAVASSSKRPAKVPQNYYQQYQHSTTRFSDALVGPDSPARKLDFGTPKNAAGSKTPTRRSEEEDRKLAPSPEIKVPSRSRLRSLEVDEDCFSTSSEHQPQSQSQSQSQTHDIPSSSSSGPSSQSQRHIEFLSAPRELPLPIDPQSEHYPGFAVYQDPHVHIPTLRLTSPAPPLTPISMLTPLDDNLDDDSDVESIDPRELVKENLPPRRKGRKMATAPGPDKTQLLSPPSARSSSVPATPPRESSLREREILTPRRLSIFGAGIGSGLGKARHTPSKEDRHAMRKILEEEVDGEQDD